MLCMIANWKSLIALNLIVTDWRLRMMYVSHIGVKVTQKEIDLCMYHVCFMYVSLGSLLYKEQRKES